jgi:dolichol-phosphate mannosyltransferase
MNRPEISIVIPLLNEESNIPLLIDKLKDVFGNIDKSWEVIFVDDGSSDNSFNIIQSIAAGDNRIKGLSLSRNFGQQVALIAGMKESKGELIITMDADLQHPPELLPELLDVHIKGFDIVNTKRIEHKGTGILKRWSSKWFYGFINSISDVKIEPGFADFRLFTRKALDAFLEFQEKDRFNRGLVVWMGFQQGIVEYIAPPRETGKSKYTIRKMMRLGFDGITAFSSRPLRIASYLGIITTFLGFIYLIYALITFLVGLTAPGWTSMIGVVILLGGIQLLCLGIIGEYISRIFNESKNRPLFFIKERTGSSTK